MKKKLFLVFALFAFVFPLTACGEEKTEKFEVTVSLEKQEGGNSFRLADCAEVSGGGTYSKGDNVEIEVRYVKDACQLDGFIEDGTRYDPTTTATLDGGIIQKATYKLWNITGDTTIKIPMKGIGVSSQETSVNFVSLGQVSVGGATESIANYKFLTVSNDGKTYSTGTLENKIYSGLEGGKTLSQVFSSTQNYNLNYIYLNDKFQPYKITWYKANYESNNLGIPTCGNYSQIEDIDSFIVTYGERICVYGVIDKSNPNNANGTFVKEALSNLETSSVYISSKSSDKCLSYNDNYIKNNQNGAGVSENCMYVNNLKNLYKTEVDHTEGSGASSSEKVKVAAEYYGITDDNYLEAVITSTSGIKNYYICSVEVQGDCKSANTNKITYPYISNSNSGVIINQGYKTLKISEFINDVLISNEIDFANTVFDFDEDVGGVVPIKLVLKDNTTYYLNYVSWKNYGNNTPRFANPTSISDSTKYTFSLNGDNVISTQLSALSEVINSSNLNSIFSSTTNDLKDDIRNRLYELIDKNGDLKTLKNYYFNIVIDSNTKEINVTFESAKFSTEDVRDYVKITKDSESKICPVDYEGCFENNLHKYIEFIRDDDLSDVNGLKITKDSNSYTYKFMDYELKYDTQNKKFKIGEDITLEFVDGTSQAVSDLEITITETTSIGLTVKQVADSSGVTTTVYIGNDENTITVNGIDSGQIQGVYDIISNGVINIDDNNLLVVVYQNGGTTITDSYNLVKEKNKDYYLLEYEDGKTYEYHVTLTLTSN